MLTLTVFTYFVEPKLLVMVGIKKQEEMLTGRSWHSSLVYGVHTGCWVLALVYGVSGIQIWPKCFCRFIKSFCHSQLPLSICGNSCKPKHEFPAYHTHCHQLAFGMFHRADGWIPGNVVSISPWHKQVSEQWIYSQECFYSPYPRPGSLDPMLLVWSLISLEMISKWI